MAMLYKGPLLQAKFLLIFLTLGNFLYRHLGNRKCPKSFGYLPKKMMSQGCPTEGQARAPCKLYLTGALDYASNFISL